MSSFWDGAGGALIGTVASALIALFAIFKTRSHERELMREQLSVVQAQELLTFAAEVRRRIDRFILVGDGQPVNWGDVSLLANDAEMLAERFFAFAAVIRPERLSDECGWLWEEFVSIEGKIEPIILERKRPELDAIARNIGQGLTNLLAEAHAYLRSDLKRAQWARNPIWKRYRLRWAWPVVSRRAVLVARDENGMAARDY